MIRPIFQYTLKTLFRKKRLTIVSIISIVLFISSIMSIFIISSSVYESYKSYLYDSYGRYTGIVEITTEQMLQELKNSPDIIEHSIIMDYGTIEIPEQVFDNNFSIAYLDNYATELANIKLLDGTLPKSSNEVLIEENLFNKLGKDAKINSSYQFNINVQGEIITKEYLIVGITENYSSLQLMNIDSKTLWPSVIMTTKDTTLIPNNIYSIVVSKSNDTTILETLSEKYSAQSFISQQFSDGSFVNSVGSSTQAILIISAIAVLVIALICLWSFSSISNVIITEQINSLKLISASFPSILIFGIFNLIILYLISIPFGFGGGIACGYWLSSYIVDGFIDFYRFNISFSNIIIAVFISLFLLLVARLVKIFILKNQSPLEQFENEKLYIRKSNIFNKTLLLKWSIISLFKNKSIYIGIVFSMSICYFVLFVGGMYTQTITTQYDVDYQDHYKISCSNGEFFSSLFIPTNPYSGLEHNDIENIMNNNEIESLSYIKRLPILVDINKNNRKIKELNINNLEEMAGTDIDIYKSEIKKYNITPLGDLYTGQLNMCDDRLLSMLLKENNSDLTSFNQNNDVIVVYRNSVKVPFEIGEQVRLLQIIAKDGYETKAEETLLLDISFNIKEIINIEDSKYLSDKFKGKPLTFVCSDNVFKKARFNANFNHIFFNLKDPLIYSQTEQTISLLKKLHPEITVVSERENESEKTQLLHTLNLVVIVLSAFIFIVCLLNILNLLSMKYIHDQRLWGTLRAIGISPYQIILHHFIEMFSVMFCSVIINVILLLLLKQIIRNDVIIFNSWVLLGYGVCPILICIFTIPLVTNVFKQPIVKQIEHL